MEEIDISSVDTSPRTDDLVVCYQFGRIGNRDDTPERFTAKESYDSLQISMERSLDTDDEMDRTKSSDCVEIRQGTNLNSIVVESDSIETEGRDKRRGKIDILSNDSYVDDLVNGAILKVLKIHDEDTAKANKNYKLNGHGSKKDINVINNESITIKNLSQTLPDKTLRNCSNESPTIFHPTIQNFETTFLRWNIANFNDNSDVEYVGRYVPTLGYRPLKNILDDDMDDRFETPSEISRTVRIKRPWFYELTIEEESGIVDDTEESSHDDEESNINNISPHIKINTKEKPNKNNDEEQNEIIINRIEDVKLKLDRDKNYLIYTKDLNSKESEDFIDQSTLNVNEEYVEETKIHEDNCNDNYVSFETDKSIFDQNENLPGNINEVIRESVKCNECLNKSWTDNVGEARLMEKLTKNHVSGSNKECENMNLKGSDDNYSPNEQRKSVSKSSMFSDEKQKLKVELNIDVGSSKSTSCSDLTSVTPRSICQVCQKRCSNISSPRNIKWHGKGCSKIIRKQEENILRHLELIRLGRLLLENPSEFFKKKSGKRKTSLFNNRKNMSFSNDRLRDIEWANKVLLQKLVSTSKRKPKSSAI